MSEGPAKLRNASDCPVCHDPEATHTKRVVPIAAHNQTSQAVSPLNPE